MRSCYIINDIAFFKHCRIFMLWPLFTERGQEGPEVNDSDRSHS